MATAGERKRGKTIAGDRRYSQIYNRGQKIKPGQQLGTEDTTRATAGNRRSS
jgi:hypothetical protein